VKIYINKVSENWVVDRFREEWYLHNKNISTKNFFASDLIWLISPWTFKKGLLKLLRDKKLIYSIYHIEDDSKQNSLDGIKKIDKFVTGYHTISLKTKLQLEKVTNKKVFYIPFWIDPTIWFEIEDKSTLFKKYNLDPNNFFVGSFQRDSLASNSEKPKLIKGPDIFLENVIELSKIHNNLEVILTGRKRNYLINQLKKNNIKFKYFEMATQSEINELYNCLNLYIISSRIEGGPQAIAECGVTNTPLVSTDVGMAKEFMNPVSIYDEDSFTESKPDNEFLRKKVNSLEIPTGFEEFYKMFNSI
tara:strand:- start:1833 stop:2744 length:912 start_codon:yes stop_codon:yes gene_type:complete